MSNLVAGDFRVVVNGRSHTLSVTPAAQVAVEQEYGCGYLELFTSPSRVEPLYWLAWYMLGAETGYDHDFQTFLGELAIMELVDADPLPG